jgi:O-antigen ligase
MLKIATFVTALLIGLTPLFFGGNRPALWTFHAIAAGAALCITALALGLSRYGRQIDLAPRLILPAVIAWMLLIVWLIVQLLPWQVGLLAHPAWTIASEALGIPLAGHISVDLTATKYVLLRLVTTGAVFASVFFLCRQRENAALLLGVLTAFFCFYAAYGLVRFAFALDRIWWFPVGADGYLTSTFIGRSHAATYFGLASVVATTLLVRALTRLQETAADVGASAGFSRIAGAMGGRPGASALIWLLVVTALFLTGSRGGILATIVAIAVILVMRGLRKKGRSDLAAASIIVPILLGLYIVFQISGEKLVGRVAIVGFEDINRDLVAKATLQAAYDHLWTGSGGGTFQSIFPLYRPDEIGPGGFWNRAHNDYAEALLCLGLPGFLFLSFILLSLNWRALSGVFQRRRDSHFSMIAIAATILVAVHASVEFSLQIQGVTLTYASLLAMGVAQAESNRIR